MQNQKTQVVPPVVEQTKDLQKKNHKKGEKKEKEKIKSQYVFDADIITPESQIPALPKKTEYLKKPQFDQFKEKQLKNRQKITKLIELKKQIRTQNFKASKFAKKGEDNKHDAFRNEVEEVKDLREKLNEVKKERNQKREKLTKLIEQAKALNAMIKQLGGKQNNSKQTIQQQLEQAEQKLISAKLSKDDEKNLNNQITLLKRKIKDAESVGNIEYKKEKAYERKEELDHEIQKLKEQKEPLEKQCKEIFDILDKKNNAIDGLKKELDGQGKQKLDIKEKNNQEWQKWKDAKKKRLDQTEQKINKIQAQNDKLWDEFNLSKQAYWKQKHYIDWVQWQMKVKSRKVNQLQREKRNKQYEEKDKQREKQEKLQKYIGEIELCNYLISYLHSLKEDFNQSNEDNKNLVKQTVDVGAKLAADSQWKKEKGLELLKSKKSKEDEEAPKKGGKKNKNKNIEQKKKYVFSIPYNVQNQFQLLKILAPSSIEQVDKKVEQLKDRQRLFVRGCQQDQPNQEDSKLLQQIKTKKPSSKTTQKKVQVDDFPTI